MMGEKTGSRGRSASLRAPVGPAKTISAAGDSDAARGAPLTGLSIVRADSLEAALEMAKGENEDVVCRGHRVGDFVRALLDAGHTGDGSTGGREGLRSRL